METSHLFSPRYSRATMKNKIIMKRRPIYTLAYLHTPLLFYSSLFCQRSTSWTQKRSEKQNHCRVWPLFLRRVPSMVFCLLHFVQLVFQVSENNAVVTEMRLKMNMGLTQTYK